jgi:hypothetical protein
VWPVDGGNRSEREAEFGNGQIEVFGERRDDSVGDRVVADGQNHREEHKAETEFRPPDGATRFASQRSATHPTSPPISGYCFQLLQREHTRESAIHCRLPKFAPGVGCRQTSLDDEPPPITAPQRVISLRPPKSFATSTRRASLIGDCLPTTPGRSARIRAKTEFVDDMCSTTAPSGQFTPINRRLPPPSSNLFEYESKVS